MTVESEVEAKFEVPGDFRLPALDERLDVKVREQSEQVLEATYYDTASLDLARWGVTLRFRSSADGDRGTPRRGRSNGKWTLKLPDPGRASRELISRTEVDFDGAPGQPPGAAQDLIKAHRRGRALQPVCELTTIRKRYLLIPSDRSVASAEIDDDSVRFQTALGRSGEFREVEVELKTDDGGILLPLVAKALEDAGGRSGSTEPKVLRALDWKPPPLPPRSLTSGSTVELVVSYAIDASLRRLLSNAPMVRMVDEAEAVHQARVATRRLRSDLATLEPLLKPKAVRRLRGELKKLGVALGTLRDTDVMLERLRESVATLPPGERVEAKVYVESLDAERRDAKASVLACLSSDDYVATVNDLIDAIDHPPLSDPGLLAVYVLPSLAAGRWKNLRRRVRRLGPHPADRDLHLVRIDAKRCRYAAELAAPVVGERAARMAEALADVQTELGELQDAVVLGQWLHETAVDLPAAEAAVAVPLIERERRRAKAARREWHEPWNRIADEELADWLS